MFSGIATAALVKKMKVTETKKGELIFECPMCDHQFNRKYNRDRHMELIHKLPRPDLPHLFPNLVKKSKETQTSEEMKNELLKAEENLKSEESMESEENQKSEEFKKFEETKKYEEIFEAAAMDTDKEGISPDEEHSRLTKICPKSGRVVKKARMNKESKKKPLPTPKGAEIVKLPIQNVLIRRNAVPCMSVHFCGTCPYFNKHRYIMLSNESALVLVPVCEKCSKLNMSLSKTVQEFKKTLKD